MPSASLHMLERASDAATCRRTYNMLPSRYAKMLARYVHAERLCYATRCLLLLRYDDMIR